jgi:hypothetical protein
VLFDSGSRRLSLAVTAAVWCVTVATDKPRWRIGMIPHTIRFPAVDFSLWLSFPLLAYSCSEKRGGRSCDECVGAFWEPDIFGKLQMSRMAVGA